MLAGMLGHNITGGEVSRLSSATRKRACEDGPVVRIATSPEEIDAAQALRYRVFYEELNGRPSIAAKWRLRDFDVFDRVADHLVVRDPKHGPGAAGVVAAVRLLRGRVARSLPTCLPAPGFSVAADFNIEPLLSWSGEVVEISRFCIHPEFRSRRTVGKLCQGIAT